MTIYKFKDFISNLIVESLHPELQSIVDGTAYNKKGSMQHRLAKKIIELRSRGETTGIEGNMPKGSSRAYLKHADPEHVNIDGVETTMPVGTKVAIRSNLDRYHNAKEHGGTLGQLQNMVENTDHFVNSHYRVLARDRDGNYETNEDGIFPPLVHHDTEKNDYSTVGHVDDVSRSKFKELTKTPSHPKGISHEDFYETLVRTHDRENGRHWDAGDEHEAHLDHVQSHPLVMKFLDHQMNFAAPPHDYQQIRNLGVWTHPVTGEQHIVARDHGFNHEVQEHYRKAKLNKYHGR